jgi:recombinational DNA repair protein (RecF pathway)
VQLGYDLLRLVNRVTEDNAEAEYFDLLEHAFEALDDSTVPSELICLWFYAQLLRLDGHTPNLHVDVKGKKLSPDTVYRFDYDTIGLVPDDQGMFTAAHIKYLRLLFSDNQPAVLLRVRGQAELLAAVRPIIEAMRNTFIRI